MTTLKPGDKFPADVSFSYIPYAEDKADLQACGRPVTFDASKDWADKKVVIVAFPGAFTPTCQEQHLPGYIAKLPELRKKGVDVVAVLSYNDAFVMSAWGKANGVKHDDLLFVSDDGAKFSKSIGWTMGERTARYAIVVDHGTVVYAAKEEKGELGVSTVDAVLAKL